jgi:hypothetical protein
MRQFRVASPDWRDLLRTAVHPLAVIPANAGISSRSKRDEIPAFAGMTRFCLGKRTAAARGRARLVALPGKLLLQEQGQPQRPGDDGDPLAIIGAGLRRLHRLGAGRLHDLNVDLGRPGEHAQIPRRPLLLGSGRGLRCLIGLRLVHRT